MATSKKIRVRFSASGYKTTISTFNTLEAAMNFCDSETKEIAASHDACIQNWENEWIVTSTGGEEIARWEIL